MTTELKETINIFGIRAIINETLESGKTPLLLLLVQLSDVCSFDAIIRTAECTGVNGIISQKNGNTNVNSETTKISDSVAFKLAICKIDDIKDALFMLQTA